MSRQSLMTCLRLLRRSNQVAPYARQFSTTERRGLRATFIETDNTNLNNHLKLIQERLIYPAYLPDLQWKMVRSPRYKGHLEKNPIVLEIDDVQHTFYYMDPNTDIPCPSKSLNKAMRLMKSFEDWENLAILLAGYKKAGIHIHRQHVGKLVRLADETGNIYSVIECAKQAGKTGLTFHTHEVVLRVLSSVCRHALDLERPESVARALKWTDVVLDIIVRQRNTVNPETQFHMSRLARGLVLLSRVNAVSIKRAAEEDVSAEMEEVADEVDLVKALWKEADLTNLGMLPEFLVCSPVPISGHGQLNGHAIVRILAQNIKALSQARSLVPAGSSQLHAVEAALSEYMTAYVKSDRRRTIGWAEEYERIIGASPSWASLPGMAAEEEQVEERTNENRETSAFM